MGKLLEEENKSLCEALKVNIRDIKVHSFITKITVYLKGLVVMKTEQLPGSILHAKLFFPFKKLTHRTAIK